MKVIATAPGFYDKLRNVGEEFDVKDGTKGSWFLPVKAAPKSVETEVPTPPADPTPPAKPTAPAKPSASGKA